MGKGRWEIEAEDIFAAGNGIPLCVDLRASALLQRPWERHLITRRQNL
jgi:hypothetical protein